MICYDGWNKMAVGSLYASGAVNRLQNSEFEKLALPLLDPLFNFARWLSGDPDEAQDLVQETFVKALKGFGSFQEGTNFRAWIFRILRNAFLTSRTGLERRNTVQEDEKGIDEIVVCPETPETALLRRADTELVRKAIAQLAPAFQEVLLLADVEEMKYQEVADVLGIPIGTVMSRLARARKQVREFILRSAGGKR
jgi:RNA polymerase sigma-70 factor (ECF subfamily)